MSSSQTRSPCRRWPFFMAGVVAGGAMIVGLLLTPSIQGWLLRRVVARRAGWKIDFEKVGLGPTGFNASGLAFSMPGVAATSEPVAIRLAPMMLMSQRELKIERIEASKILVTVTPAELAPPSTTPFAGALRLLQVPLRWELEAAHLDGEIRVRDGGADRLTGIFNLSGGGLSAGKAGEFHYDLTANSIILPPGPHHQFTSAGTLSIEQTPAHGIARISIHGDLILPHYGNLALPDGKLNIDVTATARGEDYTANISFGPSTRLALQASLDTARASLTGKVTLHTTQEIAGSLLNGQLPRATADCVITFSFNTRTGDFDLAMTGDLDARDWEKLWPQLAEVAELKGKLSAAIARRGPALTLTQVSGDLRGENASMLARIVLTRPLNIKAPANESFAKLSLEHWPLAWANPFLLSKGVQITTGEVGAAWNLSLLNGALKAIPDGMATVGPIGLHGGPTTGFPNVSISFNPLLELSADHVAVDLENLRARSANGDFIDGELKLARDAGTGAIASSGKLRATLPTLLKTAEGKLPFTVNTTWDTNLHGARLQVAALNVRAQSSDNTATLLTIDLLKPFDFDLDKHIFFIAPAASTASATLAASIPDWARLRFNEFPLAWLSSFAGGSKLDGTLTTGESILHSNAGGGAEVQSVVPWKIREATFVKASHSTPLIFEAAFAPRISLRGDEVGLGIEELSVTDLSGNRLTGHFDATLKYLEKNFTARVAFEADLPALPHSTDSFGALHANFQASFHNVNQRIVAADTLAVSVKNAGGELFLLDAPQPFIFGLSNSGDVVASTLVPLKLKVGPVPLSWLPALKPGLRLGGTLAPAEYLLSARINQYSVTAAAPVRAEKIYLQNSKNNLLEDAQVTFNPSAELAFYCETRPRFQMAYMGTVHTGAVNLNTSTSKAANLEGSIGFKGNEKTILPDTIDLNTHLDFSAFPHAHELGFPAQGKLNLTAKGDLLGTQPFQFSTNISDLRAADGKTLLPPFNLDLRGTFSPDLVLSGHVEVLLAALPRATDAAFDIKLNLIDSDLNITSALHSHYIDGAALREFSKALPTANSPKKSLPVATASKKRPSTSAPIEDDATLPFWSQLRGSFDLDLATVEFAPYRIDGIHGRLDASRTKLRIHDLKGEMFSGRWDGELAIEHDPLDTTGEHRLSGAFNITQFESARVVQTVFPHQLASIDAQINVHSTVASHGKSLTQMIDHSQADFAVDGKQGVLRLTVPKADLVSTAAVFGGTILLSPELRALGRLLKKFAEMPLDEVRIKGARDDQGEITLSDFAFDSPQLKLHGQGHISNQAGEPLMNRPLDLSLNLSAKDDLAVILGGMHLLEKKPGADGFRHLTAPVTLGGRAGAPDTTPLYNLFAKAVSGSKGTWGFLMRKLQAEVKKKAPPSGPHPL